MDINDLLFHDFLKTLEDAVVEFGPNVRLHGAVTRGWCRYIDVGAHKNLGMLSNLHKQNNIMFYDYPFRVVPTEHVWCLIEVDLPTPHGFN